MRCYKDTMGILCDTPEALVMGEGKGMSNEDIVTQLELLGNRLICLTGGEPLVHRPIELLETLSKKGYFVVVETNGSQLIQPYRHIANVDFIVDYKGASTGEGKSFRMQNLQYMRDTDYVKFVVHDEADYEEMRTFVHTTQNLNVSVGLFWGSKIGYLELMEKLIADRLDVSVNMQTHKMAVLYDSVRGDLQNLIIPKEL